MRVVIIGNSAAGLAAAETVRRLDKHVSITVISSEPDFAYSRCLIPEVLAKVKNFAGINFRSADFYSKHNIELRLSTKVTTIDPGNYCRLDSGDILNYDRLLIATGANPVKPIGTGANLDGIFTLRSYQQTLEIGKFADKAEQSVISGGGLVGLKGAYALRKRGVPKVTVLVKSPYLLSNQLDETCASIIEKEFTDMGIDFIFGVNPTGFLDKKGMGKVDAVLLEDGRELPAEVVLVGKGVTPNTGLVKNAGGQVNIGIKVSDYLETSLPEVFAAGDCIEVTDRISGRIVSSALWTLAVEQGRCAAYNMLGKKRLYPQPITTLNAVQFGSVPFVTVGNVRGDKASSVSVSHTGKRYCKLIFDQDRLIGFILAGLVDRAGVYTALVRRGSLIKKSLKEKLLEGTVSAADIMVKI